MKMIKKRIAVFLCMLMAITTVAAYVPAAQETAQAASDWNYSLWGSYGFTSYYTKLSELPDRLVVAKGTKDFYVRDILSGYKYNSVTYESVDYTGAELKDVKYESKNPDIVSIDKKTGKINAKKKGTALIKVTWHGIKMYGAIKVVGASTMDSYKKENKDLISASKKLIKIYDGKVTSKNALELFKKKREMDEKGYYSYVASEYFYDESTYYSHSEYYIYSTDAFKVTVISNQIYSYFNNINPFSTKSSNCFKISSISGKGKDVTATLSKAVTDSQMTGAQYSYSWSDSSVLGKKSLTFDIYIRDTKTNDIISAKATIKTGSKDIKIKSDKSLTKGRKYELIQYEWYDEYYEAQNWIHTGKSTFTAK